MYGQYNRFNPQGIVLESVPEQYSVSRTSSTGNGTVQGSGVRVFHGTRKRSIPKSIEAKTKRLKRTKELKVQSGSAGHFPSVNWSISQALCNPLQGSKISERIGDRITVRSIQLRAICYIANQTSSVPIPDIIRVAVIHDRQCNGALPLASDIYSGATPTILSFLDPDHFGRFSVLRNEIIPLSPPAAAGATATYIWSGQNVILDWYIPCSIELRFKGSTGVIGDLTRSNIVLATCSNIAQAQISYHFRCRYFDA